MSDFDDYFDDDVVFDEQTLAALDREEQKFFTQDQAPPPAKRQKTGNGSHKSVTSPFHTVNDLDTLPDISLEFDGNYTARAAFRKNVIHHTSSNNSRMNQANTPSELALSRVQTALHSPSIHNQSFNFHSRTGGRPFATSTPVFIAQNRRLEGNLARTQHKPTPLPPLPHVDDSMVVNMATSHHQSHNLQEKLAQLKLRLEELGQENTKIRTTLQESISAKQAKEGEVTILRKGIERTAKLHADQIASLKAEREEALSSRMRVQKDMREEIERIKAELSFKHNEQESMRATLNSSRHRKFNEATLPGKGAPSSSQIGVPSPTTQMTTGMPSRKQLKSDFLPGFQNAFNNGPAQSHNGEFPPATSSRKSRDHPPQMTVDFPTFPTASSSFINDLEDVSMADDQHTMAEDFNQLDLDDRADISLPLDEHHFEPINPVSELIRIVFTHSAPDSLQPTIHLLLQEPSSASQAMADTELQKVYNNSCHAMLSAIASSCRPDEFEYVVHAISRTYLGILPILRKWKSWSCLTAALNLFSSLLHALPNYGSAMLSADNGAEESSRHTIMIVLLNIVGEKQDYAPSHVVAEIVAVLEALCYNADDSVVSSLESIPQHLQSVISLLNQGNPQNLWLQISRFLVVLASHRNLCRAILSMPEEPGRALTPVKIPLIERLCLILVENARQNSESAELKRLILTFFALLSTSQPDVHNHLLLSTSVIPAVILYLSQLISPFWEDDEELMLADSLEVLWRIRHLNQTLFFLHYLIFSSASLLNLRQKLYVASHRVFYGLMHPFVVTFGRLTYGEAPDWIEERGRTELMALTDIARDILDHVLDGPEADRTWQTYTNDSHEEDEEEMEAELLGRRPN